MAVADRQLGARRADASGQTVEEALAGCAGACGDHAAHDHRRARGHGRAAVGHARRVDRVADHVLAGHPQLAGGDLTEHRVRALAHLRRAHPHVGSPVGAQVERGARRDPLLARSGEAAAVPVERQADAAGDPRVMLGRAPAPTLALVVRGRQRVLEHLAGAHALDQPLRGRRDLARLDAGAAAKLVRLEAARSRQAIEV